MHIVAEVWGHALRLIRKSKTYVLLAVTTLALGIGAVVAVFQVIDGALLHPLPYPDADRLVVLWGAQRNASSTHSPVPGPDVADLEKSGLFSEVVGIDLRQLSFALTNSGRPEQVAAARVSPGLFTLLGSEAFLGRTFKSSDPAQDRGTTAVISNNLWKQRYGSDPKIIGKSLTLDAATYTIVGVMPSGFRFPIRYQNEDLQVWMSEKPVQDQAMRGIAIMFVLARLKPDLTITEARQRLDAFNVRLANTYPDTNRNRSIELMPLSSELAGPHKAELGLLLGAVGLVLFIACTNVANLMLVRGSVYAKESALRVALGAGRKELILQFLSESATLAVLGTVLGLGFAAVGTRLLVSILQAQQGGAGVANLLAAPGLTVTHFSPVVFLFVAAVLVATVFLVGLGPVLSLSSVDSLAALRETGRVSASTGSVRLRGALLIGQVALSLVLAVCAGLLVRSFGKLMQVNPGFRVDHLLTYQMTLPSTKYPTDPDRARFYKRFLEQVRPVPGVESVAAIGGLPLTNWIVVGPFIPEGTAISSPSDAPIGNLRAVSPDYFSTMGIPVLSGHTFSGRDDADAQKEVMINETMARQYWSKIDPVGRRMKVSTEADSPWYTIVGVVGNIHQAALDQDTGAEYYFSYLQYPMRSMGIAVRTPLAPETMQSSIMAALRSVDPDQPLAHVASMDELVQDAARPQRGRFMLLGTVAILALLIAAVGLFASMSYQVLQRSNEIGIRMALGANRTRIFLVIVGQGFRLTAVGIAIGTVFALGVSRMMAGLLFGISSFDLIALLWAVLVLSLTAFAACALPALRAARISPVSALRHS